MVRSFSFTRLQIVKALPKVEVADDGSNDLVVPLQLNRRVSDTEADLFLARGARAEGATLYVTVKSVEEIQTGKKEWQDLVTSVSADSEDAERAATTAAYDKGDILRKANAATEYLNFD